MASTTELQAHVDHLESLLRARDAADAAARVERLAKEQATADARDVAARAEAATKEREQIRRGSWLNHLLGEQPKESALDFAALNQKIPATGWPPGVDESAFVFSGNLPKEKQADIANTALGRALDALTLKI